MTYWLQISSVDHDQQLKDYLQRKELTVIHNRKPVDINVPEFTTLRDGMALRHKSGVTVRIMTRQYNYENLSYDFKLCSNNATEDEMKLFHEW